MPVILFSCFHDADRAWLGMEFRHLRALVAVAAEANVTKAARRLRIAQPALSRQIHDLEQSMGLELFTRDRRGMRLTAAGSVFHQHARRLLEQADHAREAAQRRHRGDTGVLRIGYIATLCQHLLPPVLRTFRERFPAVEIHLNELTPTEQRAALLAGTLDLGLLGMTPSAGDPELSLCVLAEEPLLVAISEGDPLARSTAIDLRMLGDRSHLVMARSSAPLFTPWLLRQCRQLGYNPSQVREVDRAMTALVLVAAGSGVSVLPQPLSLTPVPGVVWLPLRRRLPPYRSMAAWPAHDSSPTVASFLHLAKTSVTAGAREDQRPRHGVRRTARGRDA
jgi:DNA-binding transcriptional LysR family regulator